MCLQIYTHTHTLCPYVSIAYYVFYPSKDSVSSLIFCARLSKLDTSLGNANWTLSEPGGKSTMLCLKEASELF